MKLLPLAAALALVASSAGATEGFSYGGYFRAGPGYSNSNHDRTCFQAPGADWKYRLGNECDYYGEFGLNYGIGKDDGPNMQLHWMPNFYTGGVSDAASLGGGPAQTVKTEQMYIEARNMDFMPNATFWAGTRFYGRADVHIVDTFFVNMSGTGGGIDIGLGGKPDTAATGPTLGVAFFRSDNNNNTGSNGFPTTVSSGASSVGTPGSRINVDFRDLTIFPGSRLRFTGVYTKGDFNVSALTPVGGTDGFGGSVQWNWDIPSIGGSNVVWVQYAQGSAYANMGFGGLTDPSSTKTQRIIESVTWQLGNFGGQGIIGYTEHKSTAGSVKYTSLGGRGSWAFTNNFKLVGELGYDKVNQVSGLPNTDMWKLTVAPTVAFDRGFWARPEIRLYGTYGSWNDGANTASGPTGYGDLGNKKNAFTYGIQGEVWW
jgi:maltoporin